MKKLTLEDLEDLKIGSSVLGSGGGGDPSYSLLMVQHQIEQFGPADIISIDELQDDDLIVPLSLMGAPLISMERIVNGKELENILTEIEKKLGRKPTVLMAGEIGGANAFTPFLIASKLRLPVLDADMIGRAFPKLQMSSCYIKQLKSCPAFIADGLGNRVIIETETPETLETIARNVTVAMGSSAAVAFYLMNKSEASSAVVPGTLSQALEIGKAIRNSKNPLLALELTCNAELLAKGTLIDIDQEIKNGFLQGSLTLSTDEGLITLFYQNEYLLALKEKEMIASTPDILLLLDENSKTPIMSEGLRFGLQVALLSIPAPQIWQTAEGLSLVGLKAFGYGD